MRKNSAIKFKSKPLFFKFARTINCIQLENLTTNITFNQLDKKTFEQLFKSHFVALTAFAKKYVKDLDLSKEIVHDVFVNLWDKRETIDADKPIKSYLYTSVHNRCLNAIRDHKKFDTSEKTLKKADVAMSWNYEDNMDELELEEKINRSIAALPDKCKEAFVLSRFEQLKYNEIATKLDISVKTVESHISKALKILRENLSEYIKFLIITFLTIFK